MPGQSQNRASFLALAASAATWGAVAQPWSVPTTGYEMLRLMQIPVYNLSTEAGRSAQLNATAADAMVIGIFKAGIMHGRFCMKQATLFADVTLVVRAWLEQNTDLLDSDAAILADVALLKAFPCK